MRGDPVLVGTLVLLSDSCSLRCVDVPRDSLQTRGDTFTSEVAVVRPAIDVTPPEACFFEAVPHCSTRENGLTRKVEAVLDPSESLLGCARDQLAIDDQCCRRVMPYQMQGKEL
jgi:hypothetical protein